MRYVRAVMGLVLILLLSRPAAAADQSFAVGSLIIPMDIDGQDTGMLRAFGLVYKLLLSDVPVAWCILPGKSLYTGSSKNPVSPGNSVDFTATAKNAATGATVGTHGYRGGPFVINAQYKSKVLAILNAWNSGQTNAVNVHEATVPFTAPVERVLVNAPNVGINADGNETIAYGYLNAAGIPDSAGKAWSGTSPDVMTPAAVAGPTTSNHRDGRLWGPTGLPRYCQLMSMHWSVSRDATSNEAISEMREYLLNYPVHLFAECQAVNQLEDAAAGHFVSTDNGGGTPTKSVACDTTATPNNGLCAKKPTPSLPLEFLNSDLAFAQMDGPFKTVGGSEPAYGLAPGSSYYDQGIVMIREKDVANGLNGKSDLWMTGYANFAGSICQIGGEGSISNCQSRGKVSYLGGHQYGTAVPISTNADTQGTRLFLNSLFEAGCVSAEGAADVTVFASAPPFTSTPLVTFTIEWSNSGAGVAVATQLVDTLPTGASFVSATGGGVFGGGKVTWNIGDLASGAWSSVSVVVALPSYGSYDNNATLTYKVGNNTKTSSCNTTTTVYGAAMPDAGGSGQPDGGATGGFCAGVTCAGPGPTNPCRVGACNPVDGSCGFANVANGSPCDDGNPCSAGTTCTSGTCGGGAQVQCSQPTNPCQTATCMAGSGCVVTNVGDGAPCASGNRCVTGEWCTAGSCGGGQSRSCPSPASPCQITTCDPASGCGFTAGNDGASCDDGDLCTSGTSCGSGLCQGGIGCPASTAICTVAQCGASGCQTGYATEGTDPRGDCPPVGGCSRTCNGAGSCTICVSGTGGNAGGAGGAGGGGVGGPGGQTGGGAGAGAPGTAGGGTATGGSAGSTADGGRMDGAALVDGGAAVGTGGSSAKGTGGAGVTDAGKLADAGAADGSGKPTNPTSGGGCGCSVATDSSRLTPTALALAAMLLLAVTRRRRAQPARPSRRASRRS